jgi:hypothetical protein
MPSFPMLPPAKKNNSRRKHTACLAGLLLAMLACQLTQPSPPTPSVFDSGRTVYGFFPTPPEVNLLSMWNIFHAIGEHGDVVLIQQSVPWNEFRTGIDGKSKKIEDIRNQVHLAWLNGLDAIFVVDPLNGLDRRQFAELPPDLAGADFGNNVIRSAYQNYALRLVREFHPKYLGLASEINTYADAFPADFQNFLSLYRDTYKKIKQESPNTRVFVTFQWEDIHNVNRFANQKDSTIDWERIEAFEPNLDLWVISSYPFVAFDTAKEIPKDYYASLLTRTGKPLAVGEGGFGSQGISPFHGTPQDQVDYLNAMHDQIGKRLAFWIYLILDDFNMDSYRQFFESQGMGNQVETLRFFSIVGLRERNGTSKPALAVWDGFR